LITNQYEVNTEEFFDFTNNKDNISGRIDIVIKNNFGDAIIIENKINAKDQNKQLIRYNKRYPDMPILYLTLNEDKPKKHSRSEINNNFELIEGNDFVCISYKKDILMWVENCMKEAVNFPILRETLKQYLNLIKYITNQNTNIIMKEEMFNLIVNNPKSIDSAILLENNMPYIKEKIIKKVIEKITNQFNETQLPFTTHFEDYGFVHQIGKWNFQIYSYFEGETLYLGFDKKNKNSDYTNNKDVFIKILQRYSNKVKDNSTRENGWIYCNLRAWQNSSWSNRYVNFPEEYFGIIKDIYQSILVENIDMTK
ncbi:MAG: PD-(D/E)XK nuclease family protein, partial [Clostridia bacterium]|nr:PD-(D/E)XK nuclease family protein [Clostridia bacterium]